MPLTSTGIETVFASPGCRWTLANPASSTSAFSTREAGWWTYSWAASAPATLPVFRTVTVALALYWPCFSTRRFLPSATILVATCLQGPTHSKAKVV